MALTSSDEKIRVIRVPIYPGMQRQDNLKITKSRNQQSFLIFDEI
jgi:hypothetical protein